MKTICLILALALFSACGGATGGGGGGVNEPEALPPVSLPIPTNDCTSNCISVSSPNTSGLVTVVGSEGAVPASAIVLVQISEATALNILDRISNFLIAPAYADSCSSSYPECSENFSSGTCQLTANADGSFFVRVKAALNQEIHVSYLDSENNCQSQEKVRGKIDSGFIHLDVEGRLLLARDDLSVVEVFGRNGAGQFQVVQVDADSGEIDRAISMDMPHDVLAAALMETGNDTMLHFLSTADEVVAGDIDAVVFNPLDVEDLSPFLAPLKAVKLASFVGYPYPTFNVCGDIADPSLLSDGTFDRVIAARDVSGDGVFAKNGKGYPISLIEGIPVYSENMTAVNSRPIQYYFDDYDSDLVGATLTAVNDVLISSDVGVFLATFLLQNNTTARYIFEIPQINASDGKGDLICSGAVHAQAYPHLFFVRLPDSLTTPGRLSSSPLEPLLDDQGDVIGLSGLVFVPSPDENLVYAVLADEERVIDSVLPLDESLLAGIREVLPVKDGDDLVALAGIGNKPRLLKLLVDMDAIAGNGNFLAEEDAEIIAGFHPVQLEFSDDSQDTLVVLSAGIANDGFSLLRVISVDDL